MMMIFGVKNNDVPRGRSRHKEVPVCCFARSGGDETRGRLSLRLDQPSTHLFDTVLLSQLGDWMIIYPRHYLIYWVNKTKLILESLSKIFFFVQSPKDSLLAIWESCCQNQSGRKFVSVAAVLRADQGPWEPIKYCVREIRENSEPERARVCQRVAVRARVGVTESHRDRERQGEIQ